MAVLPQRGKKTGRRREIEAVLAELPHVLFFFLVLPLTLILAMIPGSWGEAAGYADLGEVDFVASEVDLRVRRHSPRGHSVIYRATDGSGLSFREAGTRQSARGGFSGVSGWFGTPPEAGEGRGGGLWGRVCVADGPALAPAAISGVIPLYHNDAG